VGELVRVHWGNCDWSGTQGVDWGYAPGVIVGEIRWWNDDVVDRHPCGNVNVFVQGAITSYNIGRCERLPEVNDESR
jgi:hypothetical protein